MPEFWIKNISEIEISAKILDELKKRIIDWQKDYDVSVCVVIKKSQVDKIYEFKIEKTVSEKLAEGSGLNLLKARIDSFFRNKTELNGKCTFFICVGFSEKNAKTFFGIDSKEKQNPENDGVHTLNVSTIEPKFSLSQVILCDKTKLEIENVVSLLKNMNKIYNDWGFIDIDPNPRSIVNLWGPPGTGKTMTVHALSKEMEKKLLILNYADIESKYVGEAPKNLIAAFDLAQKEDAVIFFDEADSFLGKRITNVDSGSEQAINSLRSQMLMKLEEFNGIVFFATNLHENYDSAFESRILKHIEFKLPNLEARKEIIRTKLPQKAPYATEVRDETGKFNDVILTKLSESIDGFSGREIKNCVLESLVQSAKKENPIITAETLLETFAAKKAEIDSIKNKQEERKQAISKEIKKNLVNKNFNKIKRRRKK